MASSLVALGAQHGHSSQLGVRNQAGQGALAYPVDELPETGRAAGVAGPDGVPIWGWISKIGLVSIVNPDFGQPPGQ